jgi:glycosyltransferase involved in cell wall biosynthesis
MNKSYAISVVIPAYNAGKYINDAIDSVLNQTFTNFELLIIDDGSTDNTVDIIQSYSDARIVLIRNWHDSIVSALNTGFKKAKGKYIARMDADDKMFPERLKMQYELMEVHTEITVCSSWIQLFNSSGLAGILKTSSGIIQNTLYKLLNGNIIAHSTVMIRRDFLERYKLRYEYYLHAEDYKLWFEIAKQGGLFYTIPEALLYYRISENQIGNKYRLEQQETSNKIRKEILEYLMPKFNLKNITTKKTFKPSVSVVMPAYNSEKYVLEAINSILNQTFEDFEFIIIDDNSTDGTKEIINNVEDKRIIRIINKTGIGNCKSRNKGMEMAKGKYICVMDSDDIACPERFEKQYRFMKENIQYAAIGSDSVIFGNNTAFPLQRLRNEDEIKVKLLHDNVCTHSTLMLSNEFLKQNKIHYNEEYYCAADYNLLVDISRIGNITNIPEFLLFYRQYPEQITSSKNKEQSMYRNRIQLKQLENFKVRPSIDEIIIHNALMNELPLSERQLEAAEKWCNKLIEKNHKLNIFNEDFFFIFLESMYLKLLQGSRQHFRQNIR